MTTSRDDVKSSYRQSFGIFKGATVDEVAKVGSKLTSLKKQYGMSAYFTVH